MKMFLFNRKQKVKRWLVDKDFIEAKMTEQINAAAKLVFSVPLKKRLPATYFFAAIPQPRGSGYLLFKIVTEQVQSDRVQYTCIEAAYDELKSYHYIKDDRPQDRTAAEMLQMALDGTRWSVGTAYDAGTGSTNFYYINSLEAIQKIADLFKLEVVFSISLDPNSHQIVRRLVNLYAQQGERTGKRFEYGSNLLSVEREESSENLITALIGRGKGEEKYHTADGKPAEEDQTPDGYGRRINFADVVWSTKNGNPVDKPAGQEFVEDPDATAAYGFDDGKPRIGIEIFEDITDPGELLQATWSALQTLKRPKVSFKANTLDVGDLGLGDTVAIIRHDIKIEYFTRVYKVEHNLLNEKQNTIELGDDFNSQSITSTINSIASAVKQTSQTANYASVSANGKNTNNYGKDKPDRAVEGDLWYKDLGNGEVDLYQYHDGNWILITSTRDLHNVQKQVEKAQSELDTAKNDIIANKQKADTDIENLNKSIEDNKKVADKSIENLNKSIEANKKTADESLQKLNDSVANLQGQYDNNIVPDLNKAVTDAADALQKYIEAQKSITDLTKQAQQQGKDIADVTSTVNGLNINYANLAGDVSSTKADVKGLQITIGAANGDIAQLKLDAQSLQTMLAGKVDDSVYQNFVTLTNQALAAKLTASDLTGYAKTVDVQATANGLQLNIDSVSGKLDNMVLGNRNLIRNSGFPQDTSHWQRSIRVATHSFYYQGTKNLFVIDNSNVNEITAESVRFPVKRNTNYAFSFKGFQSWNMSNYDVWFLGRKLGETDWYTDAKSIISGQRLSNTGVQYVRDVVFNSGENDEALIRFDNNGTNDNKNSILCFTEVKLEEGNKSTAWTAAPEDEQERVNGIASTLSARITANSQRFSSYYTKSETDAKTDTVKNDAVNTIKGDANWTGLTNIITNSGFLQSADGFVQKVQQTALPMVTGGGVNLLHNSVGLFRPIQKTFSPAIADNYETYGNSTIEMIQGQTYTVSGQTNGVWSGTHDPDIESDKCILWLTDTTIVSKIISADVMPHVFTWNYPSGTYKLRVNAYHHGADNPIYAEKVKIERGSTATPWSPNPADLVTQVAFAELTQTVNGLQSTVSGNYGTLQTQISQTAAAIRGELTDSANGLQTQITAATNGLSSITGRVGSLETLTSIQVITQDIDANDYVNTGNYLVRSGNSTNVPIKRWFYLEVKKALDQRIIQIWQADDDPALRYTRTYSDHGWSDWQRDTSYAEYSALNQTVQGLQSTVSNNYGALQTQITQTATAIRSELTNQINGVQTQITTTASGLTARIDGIRIGGTNLLKNSAGPFQPTDTRGTTDNYEWYQTTVVEMVQGQQYTLSASTNGVFSGDHTPGVESDKCILWLVGSDASYIISDSNTAQGTTFTWKRPTGTYFLRVNVYHPASTNTIKAWNIKIERGNKATDWSPAPEDTTKKFAEVNATINGLQSTVGSNYSALQSQINQTASTIRGEVTNSVSGLQTQLTQQANGFNVSLNTLRSETAWQTVTTAIDANNYTATGNYWIQATSNSNTPDGSAWAYLQVVAYPDVQRIKQTWQRDNNANEAYTRLKTGNNWSEWQKTVTAGNIMAQINMSAGTTLIQNNKIYMDADSTIFSGKAFIPSAAITDLSADKITTGTLNAGNVNIINMNADNIVAGTIKGTDLSIGLNSGEVEFQHGRIHNFDNTVDIDLDKNYISTADLGTRVLLKNGELQLTKPSVYDTNNDSWYFKLTNWPDGNNYHTALLSGRHAITLSTGDGITNTGAWASSMGTIDFRGVSISEDSPTVVGGGPSGMMLKAGTEMSIKHNIMDPNDGGVIMTGSPYILIGTAGSSWNGNRIIIDGEYVHIPSTERHTTGESPNVYVAPDGALLRSTSASKYKTMIERSHSLDYGERLLSLPTATWIDKAESRRYASGESDMKPVTHFGMIAEDLAAAGLEMLVSRGQDGELEGIQYDRIAPALLPVIKKLQDRIKKLEERLNG